MMTIRLFSNKIESIPMATSWYLSELSEYRGKQLLYTRQVPQKLRVLREHAVIESVISSNRIEGVEVDQRRVGTILFGKPLLRNRNEEEIRGYRNALKKIHEGAQRMSLSESTILDLHLLSRGEIWDAGHYKDQDGDIIEKYPDGRERVRFKTVPATQTPEAVRELCNLTGQCFHEKWIHPLITIAAFNLDFLCIHPFRDGNGRMSRLLLLVQCYQNGYEVGRYISLERIIEENKERYYETLEQSSMGWHEARHNPWPYINFLLFILKEAYKRFETRVGETKSPKGAKTELVESVIKDYSGEFTLAELERDCFGVSRDMIRKILGRFREEGKVECLGKGPKAPWRKKGNTPKKG